MLRVTWSRERFETLDSTAAPVQELPCATAVCVTHTHTQIPCAILPCTLHSHGHHGHHGNVGNLASQSARGAPALQDKLVRTCCPTSHHTSEVFPSLHCGAGGWKSPRKAGEAMGALPGNGTHHFSSTRSQIHPYLNICMCKYF